MKTVWGDIITSEFELFERGIACLIRFIKLFFRTIFRQSRWRLNKPKDDFFGINKIFILIYGCTQYLISSNWKLRIFGEKISVKKFWSVYGIFVSTFLAIVKLLIHRFMFEINLEKFLIIHLYTENTCSFIRKY